MGKQALSCQEPRDPRCPNRSCPHVSPSFHIPGAGTPPVPPQPAHQSLVTEFPQDSNSQRCSEPREHQSHEPCLGSRTRKLLHLPAAGSAAGAPARLRGSEAPGMFSSPTPSPAPRSYSFPGLRSRNWNFPHQSQGRERRWLTLGGVRGWRLSPPGHSACLPCVPPKTVFSSFLSCQTSPTPHRTISLLRRVSRLFGWQRALRFLPRLRSKPLLPRLASTCLSIKHSGGSGTVSSALIPLGQAPEG